MSPLRYVSLPALAAASAGYAASPSLAADMADDAALSAAARASIASSLADAKVVELESLNQPTVCRQIRRPGSRIIAETRCFTPDARSSESAMQSAVASMQVDALRREQDDRRRRELEREMRQTRGGPWAR